MWSRVPFNLMGLEHPRRGRLCLRLSVVSPPRRLLRPPHHLGLGRGTRPRVRAPRMGRVAAGVARGDMPLSWGQIARWGQGLLRVRSIEPEPLTLPLGARAGASTALRQPITVIKART